MEWILIMLAVFSLAKTIILCIQTYHIQNLNQKMDHICLSVTIAHPKIDRLLEMAEDAKIQKKKEVLRPELKKSEEASERMRKYWKKKREADTSPKKPKRKQIPDQVTIFVKDT